MNSARLAGRRIHAAKCNVVRASFDSRLRKRQVVVTGHTDDGTPAQKSACGSWRQILLAKVHTGRAAGRGKFRVVVDDQRNAELATQGVDRSLKKMIQ